MHPRHPRPWPASLRPAQPRPIRLGAAGLASGLLALAGCGIGPAADSAVPSSAAPPSSSAGSAAPCAYPAEEPAAKPVDPPSTTGVPTTGTVKYVLAMTGGNVTITMDRGATPCTVNSFASLAEQGYFDGTSCHRLVDAGIFVLQCVDPTGTGSGGPGYSFADELTGKESYESGVVAMANAGPGTNGSQFFLVWDDSRAGLAPNYTIFGRMDAASRDAVARMAQEGQDGSNGEGDGKPNNAAEITRVTKG